MSLSPARWRRASKSEFPWERDALQYLADNLPDREPVRLWSNFEFVSADGARSIETDNPLVLADRKARRLAALLAREERRDNIRLPFDVRAAGVVGRGRAGDGRGAGRAAAVTRGEAAPATLRSASCRGGVRGAGGGARLDCRATWPARSSPGRPGGGRGAREVVRGGGGLDAGVERIFGDPFQDPDQNALLRALKEDLYRNRAVIARVYIQFVFNGDPQVAEQSPVLDHLREDLESKKYLIDRRFESRRVDLVVQFLSNTSSAKTSKKTRNTCEYDIEMENHLATRTETGEELHVGFIHLADLHDMYREMRQRLFERNIRSALSAERPANRELRRAFARIVLDGTEAPDRFVFNHNGVAIAAEKFEFNDGRAHIVEPRVLNGAQTLTSLDRFVEDNNNNPALDKGRARLRAMRVLAKVVCRADDRFVVGVTVWNNRQNPVEPWHLRASDMIQLELEEKFREDLGLFYQRQEGAFEQLTDEDLEEVEAYRPIEIKRLAQTFLAVQGEINRISRMPDVFDDEKIYASTFRQSYLSAPADKIVLAYKIQYRLLRLIREITERGENKYAYLRRAKNLVWALLVQAVFNDSSLDRVREQFGQSLAFEADYGEYLRGLASTKVRFFISEVAGEPRYKEMIKAEKYSFLRNRALFDRCMEAAFEKYEWTKRSF